MVAAGHFVSLLALGLLASASLAGGDAPCGETEPCEAPTGLGPVASVRILENAHAVPGMEEPSVDCRRFRLTPELVKRYLRKAGRITENSRQYIVSDSACVASGEVEFKSGKRATWVIGMLTEGRLTFTRPDGSNETMELYCGRCRFEPFVR